MSLRHFLLIIFPRSIQSTLHVLNTTTPGKCNIPRTFLMHGTGTATLVGRAHFTLQIKRKERRWETTNRTAKKRKRHTTKDSREKKKLIKIDMVLCIYIRERELCVHDQLAGIDYAMQIRSLRFNTFLGKERCRVLSLCDMPPHTTNAAVFVTRKPNLFFFFSSKWQNKCAQPQHRFVAVRPLKFFFSTSLVCFSKVIPPAS